MSDPVEFDVPDPGSFDKPTEADLAERFEGLPERVLWLAGILMLLREDQSEVDIGRSVFHLQFRLLFLVAAEQRERVAAEGSGACADTQLCRWRSRTTLRPPLGRF
jgi:hypothetical protein